MENNEKLPVFTQAPEKISKARERLFASDAFLKTPIVYQTMVKGLLTEEYGDNLDYIVNVATNENVIEKQDLDIISKVAEAHPWKDEIEEGKNENYHFIMRALTNDILLNQPDVKSIINTVLTSETSMDAQRNLGTIVKKIRTEMDGQKAVANELQPVFTQAPEKISKAREKLFASNAFLEAPTVYQTMVKGLLTEEYEKNLDYIVKVATHEKVIKDQDLGIISKIAEAHPWNDEIEQGKEDNYHFVMGVLTNEKLLNKPDASSIIDSVLGSKTSKEAELQAQALSTIYGKSVDAMINEATATQPQNSGMKR